MEVIVALIGSTAFGSILTLFFTRNKNNADVDKIHADTRKTEIDTVEKAITIWRQMTAELDLEVIKLRKIGNDLTFENQKLQLENQKLHNQVNNLVLEVSQLREHIKELVSQNENLTNRLDSILNNKNNI